VNVSLPRVRDFRGVSSKSFDGRGNYTLGMKDQLIFPEIDYNKVDKTKGMNICITTTAKTDAEGLALLKHMGMPFRREPKQHGDDAKNRKRRKTGAGEKGQDAEVAVPPSQSLLPLRTPRGYLRKFKLCRICFRKLALAGEVPGVIKASW